MGPNVHLIRRILTIQIITTLSPRSLSLSTTPAAGLVRYHFIVFYSAIHSTECCCLLLLDVEAAGTTADHGSGTFLARTRGDSIGRLLALVLLLLQTVSSLHGLGGEGEVDVMDRRRDGRRFHPTTVVTDTNEPAGHGHAGRWLGDGIRLFLGLGFGVGVGVGVGGLLLLALLGGGRWLLRL